jgi:glycosyltransferase involved in cell wall biosynthesis
VLYVGGFLPLHGVDVILGAAERLSVEGGPAVVFDLVGDGIEYHAMRARAAQAGLTNVVFHGRRPLDELARRMAGAHVVLGVFQRDGEGERVIPNKVVQGLAAGRCIVTAASEASCELLVHDQNAVLVPPGDPGALARALAALADDPARRTRLAAAGRAMARTTLSPEATARQLLIALGARTEREPAGALRERRRHAEPSMAPAAPAGA